jgi:hypothetical protein
MESQTIPTRRLITRDDYDLLTQEVVGTGSASLQVIGLHASDLLQRLKRSAHSQEALYVNTLQSNDAWKRVRIPAERPLKQVRPSVRRHASNNAGNLKRSSRILGSWFRASYYNIRK